MSQKPESHIEPSEHSTDEVDDFLDMVEDNVDDLGAASPAIKPNKELGEDGKPESDTQAHQST